MPDPPLTPTPTSTKTVTSVNPTNIGGIRRVLADNNMHFDDYATMEKYSDFLNTAEEILKGSRHSAMKADTHRHLRRVVEEYGTGNELTFLVYFWRELLRDVREVQELDKDNPKQPSDGTEDEAARGGSPVNTAGQDTVEGTGADMGNIFTGKDPSDWIERAWDKDFLRGNWGADFIRDSVPAVKNPDDLILAKLLASLPKVRNPRPDLLYGLKKAAFTDTEQMINTSCNRFSMLSADLFHAFFIVEAKSSEAPIEEAENQCCRAGAAMVSARRQFNAQADEEPYLPTLGADPQSIAFSLALVPSKAHMFAHWAECTSRDPEVVIYHMSLVGSYDLNLKSCFTMLRHDIDNIFDWGVLKRKTEIQAVLKRIGGKVSESRKRTRTN